MRHSKRVPQLLCEIPEECLNYTTVEAWNRAP